MNITYNKEIRQFKIDTENTSYVMCLADEKGYLGHAYYGCRVPDENMTYLTRMYEGPKTPTLNPRDSVSFGDYYPFEYPTHGVGDFRESALKVMDEAGHTATTLTYASHEIYRGKKGLIGLPATWGNENDSMSLEIVLRDTESDLEVVLIYSVFEGIDAITRSAKVRNVSGKPVKIMKAASSSFDMDNEEFDKITLFGSWGRERGINRTPINYGFQGMSSKRGVEGHQHQPFTCILEKTATQNSGRVYGQDLIYSGNFKTTIERSQFDSLRLMTGINPEDFCWRLEPGEEFVTPEAVLVYSEEGIGGMSRIFHDLYREHLIRGAYRDKRRPVLINNWEATYFDFDEKKLTDIAECASKLGIEMLVMDDGWFGNRFDDNRALGDWVVNEEKLKGGLKYLVDEVNKRGMKFGMWFEPEMVCPDSDTYREHPDYAIQIEGRTPGLARNQLVLDFTRPEVVDYIYEKMYRVLKSANVEYVKWDMNRPLCDIGSATLPAEQMGEFYHRYVLGVYALQERLLSDFPDLLLENCSSGGGRFDAGMLYYGPQIWTSDDTDCIERLKIQEGTELVFPLSAMGAHVSDCPNHIVGRTAPFKTRGHVALAGTFGYELDVTRIPESDRNMIPEQVAMYNKYNDLVRKGDYYRLASFSQNGNFDCWEVVSKDRTEALVTAVMVHRRVNMQSGRIKLFGLDSNKKYRLFSEDGTEFTNGTGVSMGSLSGETLMKAGFNLSDGWGDYTSLLIHVKEV